jgi:GTP cyclohydrolase II
MSGRDYDDEEKQLKLQLAQFSFDMFIHAYSRHCSNKEVLAQSFEELTEAQRFAWEQSAWALKDLIKMKGSEFDRISKQNDDVGYMLYNGVKTIMKLHTGVVTYKKFPDAVKAEYRELAAKVRFKLEDDEIGD